jgi:hypothetical protein
MPDSDADLRKHIKELVDAAPPLSPAIRDRLALLFEGNRRRKDKAKPLRNPHDAA